MDRPTWYPFRDAAMRADINDLSGDRVVEPGAPAGAVGAAGLERERMVRNERGVPAHAEPPVERRRFSLGATFLGWCVAAFWTVVLSFLLAAVLGTGAVGEVTGDGLGTGEAQQFAIASLVGYLVISFLAYVIGGYAAGRIALWDGVRHGLLTVGWAVLFAIVAVAGAAYLGDAFNVTAYLPAGLDLSALSGYAILTIALSLAAMLGGAAVGGKLGERYHERVHGAGPTRRTSWRTGGRPL